MGGGAFVNWGKGIAHSLLGTRSPSYLAEKGQPATPKNRSGDAPCSRQGLRAAHKRLALQGDDNCHLVFLAGFRGP